MSSRSHLKVKYRTQQLFLHLNEIKFFINQSFLISIYVCDRKSQREMCFISSRSRSVGHFNIIHQQEGKKCRAEKKSEDRLKTSNWHDGNMKNTHTMWIRDDVRVVGAVEWWISEEICVNRKWLFTEEILIKINELMCVDGELMLKWMKPAVNFNFAFNIYSTNSEESCEREKLEVNFIFKLASHDHVDP